MKRHFSKQSLLRTMMIVATLLFMMPVQNAWADNVATATVDGNTYTYSSLEAAVSAANGAQSTATVTLLKDITEQPCSLEVKKPMIIDLNGHVVNADNLPYAYGVFSILNNSGQVVIKNGTISRMGASGNFVYAIYNYCNDLILENVTVKNTYSTDNPCLYNNGTLTISKNITLVGSIKNSGTVQIASGQKLYDKNGIEYSGYINSLVANLANNTLSSLVTVTANGTTDSYNSLESAVSAATYAYIKYGTAATVKLNHDITQQTCSLEVKKPMIIDLNNHRINSTANFSLFYIYLSNDQQMTIKNGSIRGTEYDVYIYKGEAVLENITAEAPSSGSNCVRVCNTCTLTISKSITFDASIDNSGIVKIADGQTLYDKNGIEYSGYINSRVANLANNTLSSLVTVTANGTTTSYNSLQDAVSAANSAESAATITLNHDITEQPCSLEVKKPMIIDLNGHVVNANNLNYGYGIFSIMNAEGQVIIKNGTISRRGVNDYNGFAIYNYNSNVELENVTVKNTYSTDNPCLYNNGTLTISKNITLVGSIKNSGTVQIADGQLLGDASGKYYLGTLTTAQVDAIANNTLSSLSVVASGSCGTDVKWALTGTSPNYTLTISGTGTISTNPWYNYRADITTVVINNGVTDINSSVFMNTPNLTSVTIPASVTSIGQQAFDGCTNLETVSGCEGVTDVGNDAFSGTKWLTDQPDGVVYIGKVAYLGKNVSGEVNIKAGTVSISNNAFKDCTSLTSVTIPSSVESIGDYAFGYCTCLASVTIPVASLTYYGVSAFDDTAAGLKIYVPGSALSTYKAATNWSDYKDNFVGVYTLTYDLAGGTLPAGKSNPESYTAEDKNFLLNNPTKEGYAFAGWKYDYTEGNNTSNHTEVFVDVVPFWEQDLSFTATWVAEDESHKDLAKCRAEVDNPLYRGGSGNYVGYYYDGGYGIKVYDGETLLTYGTDYSYSMLVSLDGGSCDDMGEHCRVLLTGEGNYVGGLSADVVIVANSVNGKWGDLKWAYDNGTLTISRKDGVTEDVVMDPMSSTGEGYDSWLGIGSGIFSIVFEEGVKTIAETAFGYEGDGLHHYSNLATISLPSSLTEIGANAFAHCDGLTVDLDDILAKNITLGNNAFYQIGCLAGSLANMANNATKIALLYQAARANVTLSDRTLYKDGNWNTLCLPFALGNAMADEGHHFDGTPLEGATVMELKVADSEFDAASGTLSLFFTDAKSISAGTPYIVKWEGDGTNNLVNPLFTGVKVFTDAPTPVQSHDEKVQFRGIYSSTNIYSADHDNLFLGIGKNNQNEDVSMLFWPNTTDYTLGAFRAYFHVDLTETNGVRDIVLNFEDGTQTTGIIGHTDNTDNTDKADAAWYSLDGRKLEGMPTKKGLYIYKGRKVARQ